MNKVKEIIVLGSPRSGTSLTAGILTSLGVDMGEVRKADFENPRGYFEDVDFSRLMEELFKRVSLDVDGFHPPDDEQIKTVFPGMREKFAELIRKRREKSPPEGWGWKVPSTIFVIEYLLPMLSYPHFIVVVRNPLDIATSMMEYTRNKSAYEPLSLIDALVVTSRYYEKIFAFIKKHQDLPWIVVSYESLLESPEKELDRIIEFLNLKVSRRKRKRALKLVDPNIKLRKRVELFLTKLKWKLEGVKKRL